MRLVLEQDCFDHREMYDLIKHLPPDAALWRAQEADKPHVSSDGETTTIRTDDREKIRDFFNAVTH